MSDDKYRGSLNSEGQIPAPPRECDGQFYTVKASDTLFNIAKKFGVTVRQIVDANPQIENPDIIFAGQVICIPTGRPRPTPTPTPTAANSNSHANTCAGWPAASRPVTQAPFRNGSAFAQG